MLSTKQNLIVIHIRSLLRCDMLIILVCVIVCASKIDQGRHLYQSSPSPPVRSASRHHINPDHPRSPLITPVITPAEMLPKHCSSAWCVRSYAQRSVLCATPIKSSSLPPVQGGCAAIRAQRFGQPSSFIFREYHPSLLTNTAVNSCQYKDAYS